MDKETAIRLVTIVIDELESGYYHPDMKPRLRGGERLMDSGETMFGLDRKAGAPATTQGAAQEAFWNLIDRYYTAHHADPAYYGDKANGRKADIPAAVGVQLKNYAAEIILQMFNSYAKYLDTAALQQVVQDPALLLQFFYACYNGPVAFKKFAEVVNAAYSAGTRDARKLWQLLQAKRRTLGSGQYGNKLYNEGADELDHIIKKYFGLEYSSGGGSGWLWLLGGLALFLLLKKRR